MAGKPPTLADLITNDAAPTYGEQLERSMGEAARQREDQFKRGLDGGIKTDTDLKGAFEQAIRGAPASSPSVGGPDHSVRPVTPARIYEIVR